MTKHSQRTQLFQSLVLSGHKLDPCTRCTRTGKECLGSVVLSKRCANCVKYGRKGCDAKEPDLSSVLQAIEENQVETDDLIKTLAKLSKRLAKCRKEGKILQKRSKKILQLEIHSVARSSAKECTTQTTVISESIPIPDSELNELLSSFVSTTSDDQAWAQILAQDGGGGTLAEGRSSSSS